MGKENDNQTMNLQQVLFIYAKEGKVKCLTSEEALQERLTSYGWVSTATINPARWIEAMANGEREISDMLNEISKT